MITSKEKLEQRYKLGDTCSVRVIEMIDHESWIVSFAGTLIQIKNKTVRPLREGVMVTVRVKSMNPIELEFVGG
jgi:hypothetical protein